MPAGVAPGEVAAAHGHLDAVGVLEAHGHALALRVGVADAAGAGRGRGRPDVAEGLDLEDAGGDDDLELLEDREERRGQLVGVVGAEQQAPAVLGDAGEDGALLGGLEREGDDVGRERDVRGRDVGRGGAGVAAAGLEAVGQQHDRVDDARLRGREVPGGLLERRGQRRPAGGARGVHGVLEGLPVDAIDGHEQLRAAAAHGLAGGGVVAAVAVEAQAHVDALALGDGGDDVVQHALGDGHAGLAADALGHRAGGVEDELDVDLAGAALGGRGQDRQRDRQERREDETHEQARARAP